MAKLLHWYSTRLQFKIIQVTFFVRKVFRHQLLVPCDNTNQCFYFDDSSQDNLPAATQPASLPTLWVHQALSPLHKREMHMKCFVSHPRFQLLLWYFLKTKCLLFNSLSCTRVYSPWCVLFIILSHFAYIKLSTGLPVIIIMSSITADKLYPEATVSSKLVTFCYPLTHGTLAIPALFRSSACKETYSLDGNYSC